MTTEQGGPSIKTCSAATDQRSDLKGCPTLSGWWMGGSSSSSTKDNIDGIITVKKVSRNRKKKTDHCAKNVNKLIKRY